MKYTSLVKRITKYTAVPIAVLLILIAVMTPVAVRTQAYVWPDRELVNGMTGEDVLSLQTRLAELGFTVGELDGYFGNVTEQALIAYQNYMGLYADGIAGPITLTSLYGAQDSGSTNDGWQDDTSSTDTGNDLGSSVRSLVNGTTGSDVATLQSLLENLGYETGGVDGIFGNMTEAAVIAFQKANGLYVDGIAGPLTMAALNNPSAVRASQNSNQTSTSQNTDNSGTTANNNVSLSSITRELRKGATGADVIALQSALDAQGYNTGGADGDFGNMTEAAVMEFQKAKGLYVDGIVGPITLAALSGTSVPNQTASNQGNTDSANNVAITRELKKGMNGDDVKTLQSMLEALGFPTGGIDGDFGNMTEAAVKEFQTAKGLYVDGIVGPITLAALTGAGTAAAEPQVVETPPEVEPGFTGFAGNEFGDWYFIDGEVATNKTCLVKISYNGNSGWWYVKKGKVITFIDTPYLTHISLAKGGIIINWEANEGVRKYRVYRMNSAGSWEYLADTADNYYVDTSVVSGNTYTYTVRAISPDGSTNLSGYDANGKTLTYFYEYDRYVASVNGTVTKEMVEEKCKDMGFDQEEIIALLAWVEGEAFCRINEPYLAYLSACVMINGLLDDRYGKTGEEVLNYIVRWGTSYYTVEKQKARYENVSADALLATYLALEHPVSGIYGCRGLSEKPANCYYDSCIVALGYPVYVW